MQQQQHHHHHGGGASPAAQLPEAVLARILGKVPQKQRLTVCALVNSAWAQAAAAATTDVEAQRRVKDLEAWLKQRAQQEQLQLRSICINAWQLHSLELPWQAQLTLESLDLTRCEVELLRRPRGRSAPPSNAAPLALLRSIRLCHSEVAVSSLARLVQPHLTRLHIVSCWRLEESPAGRPSQAWLPAMLRRLPQLADLRLEKLAIKDADLAPLSSLQQLRACAIVSCEGVTAQSLTALRSCGSLSALEFGNPHMYKTATRVMDVCLPSLASLKLEDVTFEPARTLRGLQQLEHLQLGHCAFLAPRNGQHTTTLDGVIGAWEVGPASPLLLEALLELTRLTHLTLDDVLLFEEDTGVDSGSGSDADEEADEDAGAGAGQQPRLRPRLQQLQALTASSALRELVLSLTCRDEAMLPANALLHMLPPGRELPGLTSLVLSFHRLVQWEYQQPVDAPDLDRLGACCPNLRELTLHHALEPGCEAVAALVRLQQRVGLTRLVLGGEAVEDDDAELLAGMAGLRALELIDNPEFSDVGLEHLTALTALQRLRVTECGLSEEVTTDDMENGLLLAAEPPMVGVGGGAASQGTATVSEQLVKQLECSPTLAALRVPQQREQLRKLTAELQQERADRQAEVAALQQEAADRQAEVVALRAEVAALRAARGRRE